MKLSSILQLGLSALVACGCFAGWCASRAEAQKLLADARTQAQAAHDEALTGLQDEVAGLAVDIAGKVLERTVTDADTRRLADEFFAAEQPATDDGAANA